jgi:hypothetical protein
VRGSAPGEARPREGSGSGAEAGARPRVLKATASAPTAASSPSPTATRARRPGAARRRAGSTRLTGAATGTAGAWAGGATSGDGAAVSGTASCAGAALSSTCSGGRKPRRGRLSASRACFTHWVPSSSPSPFVVTLFALKASHSGCSHSSRCHDSHSSTCWHTSLGSGRASGRLSNMRRHSWLTSSGTRGLRSCGGTGARVSTSSTPRGVAVEKGRTLVSIQ